MANSSFKISYVEQNSIHIWLRYIAKRLHDAMEGKNLVTFYHFWNFALVVFADMVKEQFYSVNDAIS